ncbi:SSI family serine proteinase inhibitor [Streptomyces griseosporeus]|uniref:SSI family serine proteinase inhibitor n=1 Tax=Streptomyces griseosporeus TaxID=1910 RepID=UPI003700995F
MSQMPRHAPRTSGPARRALLGVAASLVSAASLVTHPALAVAATASPAVSPASLPYAPPPVRDEDRVGPGDHLVVRVEHAGEGRDGMYEVYCNPVGGDHPDLAGACRAVERNTRWGSEPFAPVADGSVCTMQYGGPATAHVTGTWAGRPVEATFGRGNGCEIGRWDRFVPLLPDLSGGAAPGARTA